MSANQSIIDIIRGQFPDQEFIPLHEPVFGGREKEYLGECIDSIFVSSVGKYVDRLEEVFVGYTGAHFAVATVNGTAALHTALMLAGVTPGEAVITQALTFIATANAISYCGAAPVFLDVEKKQPALSPRALLKFLESQCEVQNDGTCRDRRTGQRIAACVPVHVFGHPADLGEILAVCDHFGVPVVEDAAESIGSWYGARHTGTLGRLGIVSFNGNKAITTGGGGMVLTDSEELGHRAKHITTTAKVPHRWDYSHDQVGYNYRMPNINAALGCAQMENLDDILAAKRNLAADYRDEMAVAGADFMDEPDGCRSNFWLNAIILANREQRDAFLQASNDQGVMTRPLWGLPVDMPMYRNARCDDLTHTRWLFERVVNIPSSARL
ncbi:MAG: Aminotransferase, DegT/DnrJ/EryC1/StrS family [Olavius algarvensis Delta 4 endosymbiont]|nr:MAG: Aminotransferase, DegT/DnrJ/EryC1/StrS family [Olavius algarvensis Delta 4 endosymbiont]